MSGSDPNITTIRDEARTLIGTGDVLRGRLLGEAVDAVERELADLRAGNERLQASRERHKRANEQHQSEVEDAERRLREATDALRDLDEFASNKAGYWQHQLTSKARAALAAVEGTAATPGEDRGVVYPCACGHLHMVADDEGADGGCRTCECADWRCPCGNDVCVGECDKHAVSAEPRETTT